MKSLVLVLLAAGLIGPLAGCAAAPEGTQAAAEPQLRNYPRPRRGASVDTAAPSPQDLERDQWLNPSRSLGD